MGRRPLWLHPSLLQLPDKRSDHRNPGRVLLKVQRPGAFPGLVHIVPSLAECDECDEIFNVTEQKGYCPNCGSFEKTVLSGKEFIIREIVVPEKSETQRRRTCR
ncbi:MAG: hydrogenase maturation nickel metallochaperone HypA, partial [Lachnospiraceae bacterium]|nr:hydrogenase maturation nickel metallochaperone HypA [Lachnospiraceae bacterium]